MKRMLGMLVVAIAAGMLVGGCASTNVGENSGNTNSLAYAYYNQPNTAELLHIVGTNVTLTITGATEITLRTPVPTKNIIPPAPSLWSEGLHALESIVPWLAVGYFGNEVMQAAFTQPRTVDPVVVHADTVEPTVIENGAVVK